MIIIDSSVAAKWLFPEDDSDLAFALLEDHVDRNELVVGPHLLPIELTNVIRQRMRRQGMFLDDAESALERFFTYPVELQPVTETGHRLMNRRALAISAAFDLPASYDAHYLALAELLDCPFWTADQRLLRALDGRFPLIRGLANYVPA